MSEGLEGKTVVVTRSREQSADLVERLEARGAEVLCYPTIKIEDPFDWQPADNAAVIVTHYDWVVFTSANAVERFFGRLATMGMDARAFRGVEVAAVGPATAEACKRNGLEPDFVPDDHSAEGVLAGLLERGVGSEVGVLLPRAEQAREVIPEGLRAKGATVDVVTVYRTVPDSGDPVVLERLTSGGVDAITFTSSSTARNFVTAAKGVDLPTALERVVVASIGAATSDTVRELGMTVGVEAQDSTSDGLVAALADHFAAHPS